MNLSLSEYFCVVFLNFARCQETIKLPAVKTNYIVVYFFILVLRPKLVKIVKLNIDNNPSNTQKFGIRGIPTLLLFKNGEKIDTSVGVLSKSELASFLDKNL